MGGRGQSRGSRHTENNSRTTRNPRGITGQIIDFINEQASKELDIEKHITRTTRRYGGGIIIDWNGMPRTEQRQLELVLNTRYSKYEMQDWSGWEKLISRKEY